jgi:hypothetical protein
LEEDSVVISVYGGEGEDNEGCVDDPDGVTLGWNNLLGKDDAVVEEVPPTL